MRHQSQNSHRKTVKELSALLADMTGIRRAALKACLDNPRARGEYDCERERRVRHYLMQRHWIRHYRERAAIPVAKMANGHAYWVDAR